MPGAPSTIDHCNLNSPARCGCFEAVDVSVPQQDGNCRRICRVPAAGPSDKVQPKETNSEGWRENRPRGYRITATFGPAFTLLTCDQLLRPNARRHGVRRQIVGQFDLFVFQTPCQFRLHIQGSRNAIGQQSKCEISKTGVFAASRRPFTAPSPRQRRLTSERESGSSPWFAPASTGMAASPVVRRHSHHPCPPRSTASTIRHAAFSMPICELIIM